MPITPFHLPIAYTIYILVKRKTSQGKGVSLPGLIIGSVFPDVEILVASLLSQGSVYYRVFLHSLVGAATIGTILTIVVVTIFYSPLVSSVFSIEKQKIQSQCKFSSGMGISCLLGNISHVLLDFVNHDFNTIFWPFIALFPSPISFILGGAQNASLLIHLLLGAGFIMIIIKNRQNLWENLLVGKL